MSEAQDHIDALAVAVKGMEAQIEMLKDDLAVEQSSHGDMRDTMNRCNAEAFKQRARADAAERP